MAKKKDQFPEKLFVTVFYDSDDLPDGYLAWDQFKDSDDNAQVGIYKLVEVKTHVVNHKLK